MKILYQSKDTTYLAEASKIEVKRIDQSQMRVGGDVLLKEVWGLNITFIKGYEFGVPFESKEAAKKFLLDNLHTDVIEIKIK